jgi:hypothetical protein
MKREDKMRVSALLVVLLIVLALINCPPAFPQGPAESGGAGLESPGGPLADVPERVFDFGSLTEGRQYVHDFKVKNVGTAPLEIKKVIKI